jgi:hypothetical protein
MVDALFTSLAITFIDYKEHLLVCQGDLFQQERSNLRRGLRLSFCACRLNPSATVGLNIGMCVKSSVAWFDAPLELDEEIVVFIIHRGELSIRADGNLFHETIENARDLIIGSDVAS